MGYSMSLTLISRPETDDVEHVLAGLAGRQVDGIIWAIPEIAGDGAWLRARAPAMPVPLVVVGGTVGRDLLPSIGIDNRAIGRLATGHLLEGGHLGHRPSWPRATSSIATSGACAPTERH